MTPNRGAFGGRPTTPSHAATPGMHGAPSNQYGSFAGTSNQYGTYAGTSTPGTWSHRTPLAGTPGGHTAATPDAGGYVMGVSSVGTPAGSTLPSTPGSSLLGMENSLSAADAAYIGSGTGVLGSSAGTSIQGTPLTAAGNFQPTPIVGGTPGGTPAVDGMGMGAYLLPGILVKLKSGDQGMVRSVAPDGHCLVNVGAGDPVSAPAAEIEVVRPSRKDRVKVLVGEHRGKVAQLIGIDGDEGIVKFEGDDVQLMKLYGLAKLVEG